MSRRARLLLATAAALAVLAAVGRWEGARHAGKENNGISRVLSLVGSLDTPSLNAYRVLPNFDCLLYRRGDDPFALELCIDSRGRVVEAIDRRSGEPEIWSLREEPSASTVSVDRAVVDRLLERMEAPER